MKLSLQDNKSVCISIMNEHATTCCCVCNSVKYKTTGDNRLKQCSDDLIKYQARKPLVFTKTP